MDVNYFVAQCVHQAFGGDFVSPKTQDMSMRTRRMKAPSEFRALLVTIRITNELDEDIEVRLSSHRVMGVVHAGEASPIFELPDRDSVHIVLHKSGEHKQTWDVDFFKGVYQEVVVRDRRTCRVDDDNSQCSEG
jgi:hypothetical protein